MTYAEFSRWVAYRRKRGSFNLGLRVEHGSALLAALYANAHRQENTPPRRIFEFMPHQDEPPISLEQAMKQWE